MAHMVELIKSGIGSTKMRALYIPPAISEKNTRLDILF